jgi:hypothetical protein
MSSAPSASSQPPADSETIHDTPAKQVPPPLGGKWEEFGGSSAMDDSKSVSFQLKAEDAITGWLKKETPTLVVRCQERRTDVYLVTGMSASVEYGDTEGHTLGFDSMTDAQNRSVGRSQQMTKHCSHRMRCRSHGISARPKCCERTG